MGNYSYYLESMRALSSALGKALSLAQNKKMIAKEYGSIQSISQGDTGAYLSAVIEAIPRIEKMQNEQKTLGEEYLDYINKSIKSALNFIMSFEESDFSSPVFMGFLRHLNLLSDVVQSRYSIDEKGILRGNMDLLSKVCQKLDDYNDEQAAILKQSVQTINNNINIQYVGEK